MLLIFLVILLNFSAIKGQNDLLVNTTNGVVRGIRNFTVGTGLPYKGFFGIPYAEPPIKKLRFEPPVPKSNWNGIMNTTKFGNICIQGTTDITGSEDCLFVNVIVPEMNTTQLLGVIVWIHGGAFINGNSRDQPDYLIEKGIIWVGVQYRLGVFGFLSTEDLICPGNMGLKDQSLALRWVKNNIKFFGGNPNNVTIFGQSAGGMSVAYHLQSPLSRGLFQKAIMDSGTTLMPSALTRTAKSTALALGTALFVNTGSSKKLIKDLKKVNATKLQRAAILTYTQLLYKNPKDGLIYSPVSEPKHKGAFFTGKSYEQMNAGHFTKVPILLGYNTLEGASEFGFPIRTYLVQYDVFPSRLVPGDMNVDDGIEQLVVGLLITNEYFGLFKPVSFSNETLMEYITDDQFVRGIIKYATLSSNYTSTYLYRFGYKGRLGDPQMQYTSAAHSEELNYLFVSENEPDGNDTKIRNFMITRWTDFAKFGTPNNPNKNLDPIWPKFSDNRGYMDIVNVPNVDTNPNASIQTFWNNLYERHGNRPFDTY